jgi:hypothetical protein
MPYKKKYTKAQKAAFAKRRKKAKSQRSAYRPRNKNIMKMSRQPFVETKKAIEYAYNDQVMNPLVLNEQPTAQVRSFRNLQISPIDTFLFMNRGVGNSKIIGRDIFSKYLKQKIEIKLPVGKLPDTTQPEGNTHRPFHRITQPCQIWVVWGWIKKPFGNRITPTGTQVSIQNVLDEIDYITTKGEALIGKVGESGVADSDYLDFRERRKNLWTMNKRLLKVAHTPSSVKTPHGYTWQHTDAHGTGGMIANRTGDFGDVNAWMGYPNVLQTTISWKTNRKMRFEAIDGNTTQGEAFARDSWLPYSYIVIPKQFQDAVNKATPNTYAYPTDGSTITHRYHDLVGEMKCSANMCHWFSDS